MRVNPAPAAALLLAATIIFAGTARGYALPVGATPTPRSSASADGRWVTGDQQGTTSNDERDDDTSTTGTVPKHPDPPCNRPLQVTCEHYDPNAPTLPHPVTMPHQPITEREVVAKLKLPDPTPRFGPDPSVNEWNMLVVGYNIWLWTDPPTRLTTTAHHDGLAFTLTATWTSTTFTMGDGNTITCPATTIRPRYLKPADSPSPTCSYIYQHTSAKNQPYTVTAATHWHITWTTTGQTGTFDHTWTGQRTLTIGELHTLIDG